MSPDINERVADFIGEATTLIRPIFFTLCVIVLELGILVGVTVTRLFVKEKK